MRPPSIWFISSPCESEFLGYSGEPTSILYAAAVFWDAVKKGCVECADGNPMSPDDVRLFAWRISGQSVFWELQSLIEERAPRVVCISATTPSLPNARRIANVVKTKSPESLVILGGPHEDAIYRIDEAGARHWSDVIDVSIGGDGEYILHEILSASVRQHRWDPARFIKQMIDSPEWMRAVPGSWHVTFGTQSGFLKFENARQPLPACIPRIPRDLLVRDRPNMARSFDMFGEPGRSVRTAQVITSRGCSWRCSFCTEWRGSYRRTVDDVIAEIREAVALGYGAVFFDDSTFFDGFGDDDRPLAHGNQRYRNPERRRWMLRLFDELRELKIEWGCQTRVDTLDGSILAAAKNAGCTYIYFGAESASDDQLADMHKGQSREEIAAGLDRVRKARIRIGLSLLFCVASASDISETREREESVNATLSFFANEIEKGGISVISRNVMAYYPGTVWSATFSDLKIDLWDGLPLAHGRELTFPWNRFEDGGGHHAKNVTPQLGALIVNRCEAVLGPWVIKAYIHARPMSSSSEFTEQSVTDLVHYTRNDTTTSYVQTFDGAFAAAINSTRRGSQSLSVVVIGMHLLESVRRFVYPDDLQSVFHQHSDIPNITWKPLFRSGDEASLLGELENLPLQSIGVIAIPAVLPETGCVLDLGRVRAWIHERGFRGRLICDISDLVESISASLRSQLAGDVVLLEYRDRIFSRILSGDCGNSWENTMARFRDTVCELRLRFLSRLRQLGCDYHVVENDCAAPHILAFQLADIDQFALAQRLWRDCKVLTTFIGPMDLIRVQFSDRTTNDDIDTAIMAISTQLPACSIRRGVLPTEKFAMS